MERMNVLELSFDVYQRYRLVQEVIDEIRWKRPLSILDVGGVSSVLPGFLPEDRILVSGLPDQSVLDLYCSGLALPFPDAAFDVVATADTLEHVPGNSRRQFLKELVRVSREAVIIAAPFEEPAVVQAEELFQSLIWARYGEGYSFIEEHRKNGLPQLLDVTEYLQQNGFHTSVLPNGYLHRWLPAISTFFLLQWRFHDAKLNAKANAYYNSNFYKYDNREPSYRKVLVATRTVDVSSLVSTPKSEGGESDKPVSLEGFSIMTQLLTEGWSERAQNSEKLLADRDISIHGLRQELNDREVSVHNLQRTVAGKNEQIGRLIEVLENREKQIQILNSELCNRTEESRRLASRLQAITSSLGWKFVQQIYKLFFVIAPFESKRWHFLMKFMKPKPSPLQMDLQDSLEKARNAYLSGRLAEAEEICMTCRNRFPDRVGPHQLLAGIRSARGEYNQAIQHLHEALAVEPGSVPLRIQMAGIYLATGVFRKGQELLHAVTQEDPQNREALQLLADLAMSNADYSEAKSCFLRILQLDSESLGAQSGLSECENRLNPQSMDVLISIVIPVFNQCEYTQKCLAAINTSTTRSRFELIVVNNGSTDKTADFLSTQPRLRVIHNETNRGFVEACNQGASVAGGKYLVFLNNDTLPQPDWLHWLVSAAESDPQTGLVGAKLQYPDGRLQEAGGIVFQDGSAWNYGKGEDAGKPEFNCLRQASYCSGACLLVPKKIFERIGGFDVRYAPAYFEDTDLAFAVRKLGYKVLYQPLSVVIHFEGATAGTEPDSGFKKYQALNQVKFQEKWRAELEDQPSFRSDAIWLASRNGSGQRILVVDHYLPAFDRSSGEHRSFELLKLLARAGHQVTFLARNGEFQQRYKLELQRIGIETFATGAERPGVRDYGPHTLTFDFDKFLQERQFTLAILARYEVAQIYLPLIRKHSVRLPVVVDTVDVHFLRAARKATLYAKEDMHRTADEMKDSELLMYRLADGVIAVSEEDAAVLRMELGLEKPLWVVPNIHEMTQDPPPFQKRDGLLFVGNFVHPPNPDAMLHFRSRIWPEIRRELPNVKLYIIGSTSLQYASAFAGDGVKVIGYVPNTVPFLNTCRVSISPLRYGAGMKGKIGEALVHGLPVVTSTVGAEGFSMVPGRHALIADDPEQFAKAVIRLYSDEALWNEISRNGRALIRDHFTPDALQERIETMVKVICGLHRHDLQAENFPAL